MYARMTIMQKAGAIDSAAMPNSDSIKQWSELTVAQKKEGGKGGLLLVERSTNKVLSISMWETEAAMNASEVAHKERASKPHPGWTATTEHYEIVAQV